MVSPGLVETHIHLDKSRILDRSEPSPDRGTDHMMRVFAVKPSFTVEDIHARAVVSSLATAQPHALSQGRASSQPVAGAARIEISDLKERIRKLEAIANGVDL